MITTMLTSRPEWQPVNDLLPVLEFEERLDLARKYVKLRQSADTRFQLSSASLIGFYILPLPELRDGTTGPIAAADLGKQLRDIERAAYRCKSPFPSSLSRSWC